MPELPEVETSCRGIEPHLSGQRIRQVIVRDRRLRWPVSKGLPRRLAGEQICSVTRRAKYLLINTSNGSAILHLGMSGSVRIVQATTPAAVHDHVDIEMCNGIALRFRDPRRFGSLHWSADPLGHKLLRDLGPEPLGDQFSGEYLWATSRGRRVSVKQFIMNAAVVVGVGNIYASEALFAAGIHPKRAAGRVALQRYERLADSIRTVLSKAIEAGGTTLQDFVGGDGEAGYFQQQLNVYGRSGLPCRHCKTEITAIVQGQRASFYCKTCQS
ncbi:MAG: bifunctional DNA-formamidopyrimidine glycosylase/DNA-(apurinic or apyrimidinic site) lyase [Woeseiaceae bacterium]